MYDGYIPDVQIDFHANEDYWAGKADIEEMIFKYYPDSISANNALLTDEVHFVKTVTSLIPTFEADADTVFVDIGTSTIYGYWALNNEEINNTLVRKAIAYAYNYSHFIDSIYEGHKIRAQSFLPSGFPYYNESFRSPYYNTSIARQAMMDAYPTETTNAGVTADAYGVDSANDAKWSSLYLEYYNIILIEASSISEDMGNQFRNDMDKIGIKIINDIVTWEQFIYITIHQRDRLEIWYTEWRANYMDPFTMVEPLLSNMSSANTIQCDDYLLHQWMEDYAETDLSDTSTRADLLYKIQQRAINELYVELPTAFDKVYYAHHLNLTGFPSNIMDKLYFFPCNWSLTFPDYPPSSNHPEDIATDAQGSETINWTLYDDFGGGQYRIWANDTNNNYYTWVDWTPWTNNTPLNVLINRTAPGFYNYTIEYYDGYDQSGNPDTVLVVLNEPEDRRPVIHGPSGLLISLMSVMSIVFIIDRNLKKKEQNTIKNS